MGGRATEGRGLTSTTWKVNQARAHACFLAGLGGELDPGRDPTKIQRQAWSATNGPDARSRSGGVQGCVCTVWWHSVSTYPSRGHRAALQEADGMRIKRERTCALGDSCTPPRRCWTCSLPKTRGEDDQGPEETSSNNGIRD